MVGHLTGDPSVRPNFSVVSHPPQQAVGNAGSPSGPPGDLQSTVLLNTDAEYPGGTGHDSLEVFDLVEFEPQVDAETVAKGRGEQTRTGCGPDQGKRRQVELYGAGGWSLSNDNIQLEVFHGWIEDFFHNMVQPVNLVDKEHIARFEVREDGCEVPLALYDRPGGASHLHPQLIADNGSQRCFPQAGKPVKEDMVQRFPTESCRFDKNGQVFLDSILADILIEALGAQTVFCGQVLFGSLGLDDTIIHGTFSLSNRITCLASSSGQKAKAFL
jgi:hypothetical protein